MKLAFAHDHLFQKDSNGRLFTGGSFNNQAWKRYLNHFEEITVLARVEELRDENNNKTYNNFDLPETTFQPIPSISGPVKQFTNRKEAEENIYNVLLESDALIARLPSEIGNLSIDIAKKMGKPYGIEVVACVWDALWNHGSALGKLYAPIATNRMRKRVLNSPYTLYVTNEFLQDRYPSTGVTTNVSNVEIEYVYEGAYDIRKKKLENKNKFVVGMIGSLKNHIKGWEIALKALSIVNSHGIDFEFHILGDGDIEKWVKVTEELGIREKVYFDGVLPGGEPVLRWLDNIDLYIQPSFQEGLPRAVIEAMSRGCPVMGSMAGGIPELVNKDCVHEVGNYEELAKKIKEALTKKDVLMMYTRENLTTAQNYKKNILDNRRKKFWDSFINNSIKS